MYGFYAIIMVLVHPWYIYPFGPDEFTDARFDRLMIADSTVPVAFAAGDDDAPTLLYFMGNGGALAYFGASYGPHLAAGRSVAALEYAGGGGNPGRPSEDRLKAEALQVFDWVITQTDAPVIVHGYSMGTGIALHVASERDVAAVVLDAPFVRMCDLMTRRSFLPACYLPFVQNWDSGALAEKITVPVLIQHGTDDTLIPLKDGARLAQMMQDAGVATTFHALAGGTHDNLPFVQGHEDNMNAFLDAALNE